MALDISLGEAMMMVKCMYGEKVAWVRSRAEEGRKKSVPSQ